MNKLIKNVIYIWSFLLLLCFFINKIDSYAEYNKNDLTCNTEVDVKEKELNIEINSSPILKTEQITTNENTENTENIKTELQEEVEKVSKNQISGYSLIYGNIKNISIIDYIDMSCNFFEANSDIDLDRNLFLALLYQESRCNPDIKNGIAQITNDAVVNVCGVEFFVKNKNNAISSIDWTIANYVKKYLTLSNYRKDSVSKWYVLKLHNSGTSLQDIRLKYVDKYPLNEKGDEEFLKDLENFDESGKNMFKEYLKNIGSNYCIEINSNINDNTTYQDYISFEKLFSDPKYIENIKRFYY